MDLRGDMVQELFQDGKLDEISQYCRCDVLDTYFVFLRYLVLTGALNRDTEELRVAETKAWLLERAEDVPAFATYLDHWADWPNPWNIADAEQETTVAASDEPLASLSKQQSSS
jgi:hypothetical protein